MNEKDALKGLIPVRVNMTGESKSYGQVEH